MNATAKVVGVRHGFKDWQVGTHSIRIGSATSLIAAGASWEEVMRNGRWHNLKTAMKYAVASSIEHERRLRMLQSSTLQLRDVRHSLNIS